MDRDGVTFVEMRDNSGVFTRRRPVSQSDPVGRNAPLGSALHVVTEDPKPHWSRNLNSAPGPLDLHDLDRCSLPQRMDHRGLAVWRETQCQFIEADLGCPKTGRDDDRALHLVLYFLYRHRLDFYRSCLSGFRRIGSG